jgi:hypothetical protein
MSSLFSLQSFDLAIKIPVTHNSKSPIEKMQMRKAYLNCPNDHTHTHTHAQRSKERKKHKKKGKNKPDKTGNEERD